MESNRIRLDYYEGANDGPRIMLAGSNDAPFVELYRVFDRLAGEPRGLVLLHWEPFILASPGVELEFMVSTGTKRCGLRRMSRGGSVVFQWVQESDDWLMAAELMQPVLEKSSTGHQYLAGSARDDATIVVSKGEYTEETLKAAART